MFQKILVALDHSETSKQAFEQALFLAQATNARLMLVNVVSPAGLDTGYPNLILPMPDTTYLAAQTEALENYFKHWDMVRQQDLALLQSCAEQATAVGISTDYTQPLGDAGKEICQLARAWKADLIVMGRRGRTGLNELIQGSVSNYVTHRASCSVLTVQGRLEPSSEET